MCVCVLQTAIAKSVLESQFVKLGMIPPEHPLPPACRSILQVMWANNGDTISKQYAGTSALKVRFTNVCTNTHNFHVLNDLLIHSYLSFINLPLTDIKSNEQNLQQTTHFIYMSIITRVPYYFMELLYFSVYLQCMTIL